MPAVRLVDSHAHLQAERFAADVDLVIGAARLAGVERILVPGWDALSTEAALALCERFSWLDAAAGVHPHDAATVDEEHWIRIVDLAVDPRIVAIGETGLDSDRMFSPWEAQLANLRRNLALSAATGKPAILHCRSAEGQRDAQDALLAEIRRADVPSPLIHSYSGPIDYGESLVELGATISFSGLAFRRGEEASAEVARLVPADRLLVETDSPFLSPPGAPRRRNEPEWVRVTAEWLARVRGADQVALGEALVASYDRFTGRPQQRST
jgi:TatD DNase family protein